MGLKFKALSSLLLIIALLIIPSTVFADAVDNVKNSCDYEIGENENPGQSKLNCLLTEMAMEYDVPPEIVKAIAWEETNWRHFDSNGNVIISDDDGIGIMQITNQSQYDEQLLMDDIVYNIKAGVEILDSMFDRRDLPTINLKNRDFLEHWYFAIMGYNGTKPKNSPVYQSTGERNLDAYQEQVIQNIADYSFVQLQELPFTPADFEYDSNSSENINFVTMKYNFDLPFTKSKHDLTVGDKAITTSSVKLRPEPNTLSSNYTTIPQGEIITITGSFVYDTNPLNSNQFVWYPVKRSNGQTGYVSSSYLKFWFKDVPKNHYSAESINYLADRGIIAGIGNGNFGMNTQLTRAQVALMVVNATNLDTSNRPALNFTDVPSSHFYYDAIATVVDEGIFYGTSSTKFSPDSQFTRNQMVTVLQRIYDFPDASTNHPFIDVRQDPNSDWYEGSLNNLYEAGIVAGITNTKFGPLEKVSRAQFAAFLARAMNPDFRIQ
ncbi:S-layer homology domain-containing protein [Ornithinibacillus sp. 179-J 7C1 HS]|uniref:S-layer homology domain-containing protein n=1 Tax=Ornithinibacillus sp. 179-J 7C1 HS TaxID=3142384 RepID=UPI0039A08E31